MILTDRDTSGPLPVSAVTYMLAIMSRRTSAIDPDTLTQKDEVFVILREIVHPLARTDANVKARQ